MGTHSGERHSAEVATNLVRYSATTVPIPLSTSESANSRSPRPSWAPSRNASELAPCASDRGFNSLNSDDRRKRSLRAAKIDKLDLRGLDLDFLTPVKRNGRQHLPVHVA